MNYDMVLHVDAHDPAILNLAFNNAANYRKALPGTNLSMVMVANGPAVQLFTRDNEELARRGAELIEAGLDIRLCHNAMHLFKIKQADVWEGCQVVPAGILELVKLQNSGHAYIKP